MVTNSTNTAHTLRSLAVRELQDRNRKDTDGARKALVREVLGAKRGSLNPTLQSMWDIMRGGK